MHPTFVLSTNRNTAPVVMSSQSSLTEGARECFHLQAFTIPPPILSLWGAYDLHCAKKWWPDCRSPLPHPVLLALWILSRR